MTSPVLFWKPIGKFGWMSNWSLHPISENGVEFPTLEHYIMYHKALLMQDDKASREILKAKTPLHAKQIGRKVKNFDGKKWDVQRCRIIQDGVCLKVSQHPELRSKLLETGDALIAEASPFDRVWGIGLSANDPSSDFPDMWKGMNILGQAWMKERSFLKRRLT